MAGEGLGNGNLIEISVKKSRGQSKEESEKNGKKEDP